MCLLVEVDREERKCSGFPVSRGRSSVQDDNKGKQYQSSILL